MMKPKTYRTRYLIEEWNKPPDVSPTPTPVSGVSVSSNDFGYTDDLFFASILRKENGEIGSILLLSSEGNEHGKPSKEMLLAVRDMIDHQLQHHM